MLQSIRDRTQGWIAGIIISLLILSFALWGIHSYLVGGSATASVATVNGVEITKSQLAVAYDRLRRQLQTQFSPNYGLPEGAEAKLKERALQTLINIQVLKQASIKQDYRVSDRQVDSLLENMPEFQVNNQFSLARFQQILSATLFTPNDFLDLLKTSLLIDQPRLGLVFTSFDLPNEVTDTIALVNQERDVRYAVFSTQSFINQINPVSHDEVEAYYNAHQNDYKTLEQVTVQYIELSVNDLMSAIHPSDSELKNFYNENSNSFASPTQWNIQAFVVPVSENATSKDATIAQNTVSELQQKLAKNGNFSELAHQYATDNIPQGWLTLNKLPQELQKTVVGLTKPGQIAAPVRTSSGFVFIKALDIKQAKVEPFEQAKDKVKNAYVHQQAEEKFANLRDKLANSTYEHPDSLQPAAQTLGLTIKTSDTFTKETGGKDISTNTKIREAAFSNDVLNLQNNSDVIQLNPDTALVLRVKSHTPATLLPLTTVEKQITDILKAKSADVAAAKQISAIKEKLASGSNAEQIAQQFHFTWNNVGFITRHATKVDSAVLNEAFAMPRPTRDINVTYSVTRVANGYAIVALSGVKDGSLNNKQGEYELFAEQIQNAMGSLEYELYKNSLMKQSSISIEAQFEKAAFQEQESV